MSDIPHVAIHVQTEDGESLPRLARRRPADVVGIQLFLAIPRLKNEKLVHDRINLLPTRIHDDTSESMCPICLNAFEQGDAIKILRCNHEYHEKCIRTWCSVQPTCPLCRVCLISDNDLLTA